MNRLIVSVSGVRGVVGESLTPEVARRFGCAFGTMLGTGRTVVLGRDTRPSGTDLQDAVTAGLLDTGVSVVNLGIATSPGTALMTGELGADGGVVITASHNPGRYNGIKFFQATGTGLTAGEAARLKGIWESQRYARVGAGGRGGESSDDTVHRRHVARVLDICDADVIARRNFKVVVDSVNGAGCIVTPKLLEQLGCELIHVNGEPTGEFAHDPEPIAENLADLCEAVRDSGAVAGFAQDADADRLAVVDESGRFIGEEYTLALAAAFVLRHRKGDIATNSVTSRMVDDLASAAGVRVVRTSAGEANVVEGMVREGCILGGEGGGGVIEPRVVLVRNSLVGIAFVLQYMAETGRTLSELVHEIPAYVMLKTKLPCPPGAAERVVVAAREAFAGREGARLNEDDGLRVDLPRAWVSVRASNTEPIMRIMAEAPEREAAEALVADMRKIADTMIGDHP